MKVRRGCRRSVFLGEGQVERQLHCLSHQGMCPASIYRRPKLYDICVLVKFSHHAEAQADQCVCVCVCSVRLRRLRRVGCWLRGATGTTTTYNSSAEEEKEKQQKKK